MFLLIKKSESAVVHTWMDNAPPRKILIPETKADFVFGATHMTDIGDAYILIAAEVITPPFDSVTQIKTGPVFKIAGDFSTTETYTIRNKTTQEIEDEKDGTANIGIETTQNKMLRDALWELVRVAKGEVSTSIPALTDKASYTAHLKSLWKGNI